MGRDWGDIPFKGSSEGTEHDNCQQLVAQLGAGVRNSVLGQQRSWRCRSGIKNMVPLGQLLLPRGRICGPLYIRNER
jgi:hypothetical protein